MKDELNAYGRTIGEEIETKYIIKTLVNNL